jgi:hypothetical protein
MPFGKYARHGWVLCPIARGSKAPTNAGWNLRANGVTDPDTADQLDGAGLMHAYSGTCAIDVDDMPKAIAWCAEKGIDLPALFSAPDAVQISSGKGGHGKLLYRLAEPLRGKAVTLDKQAVIDFRCATAAGASQQDVLPPTMHPDTGKPYGWLREPMVADWDALPALPDGLLRLWQGLLTKPAPAASPAPEPSALGFEEVQAVLLGCDPDSSRDEWVKILAAVHHATGGSAEGLALATAWSQQGKKFAGAEDVATRWRSFSLNHPKPITMASLRKDDIATADEFPDEPPEDPTAPPPAQNKEQKAAARKELESRLVYVRTLDKYFDKQTRDVLLSDHAIAHRFTPFMPKVRGSRIDPVKLLKESTLRGAVDAVGFHPGEGAIFHDRGDDYANYYRPRIATPLEPTARELDTLGWLFARVGDDLFREWLLKFLGHVVQKPGIKIQSAPLIWSEIYGNGKSTILKTIPSLLVGSEYSQEVSYALLESNFNDFLLRAWHVNLTEFRSASRGERASIAAKLKPWITDASISIHPKGLPAYSIPNRLFLTATSNEPDAAPLDEGDRRWGVYEMTAPQMTETEGMALYDEFLHTGRAAGVLRHFFMSQSLTGFNPNAAPPHTAARTEMIEASISSDVDLLRNAFEECKGPFVRDVCTADEVQNYLHQHLKFRPGPTRIGRILRKYPFVGQTRQIRHAGAKFRIWAVRNQDIWMGSGEKEVAKYLMDDEINVLTHDPLLD